MTRRALSPVALSRLTWSASDRQAWDDAYRAARNIAEWRRWDNGGDSRDPLLAAELRDARTVDYNYYGHSVKA